MREDVIGRANVADSPAAPNSLLAAAPRIINVGLELFAENLASQGAAVVHVRWSPPAGGNARLASLLTKLRS
jgi:FdrA protein